MFCTVFMLASTNQSGDLKISSRLYEKLKIDRAKYCGNWVKNALKGKTFEDMYDDVDYIKQRKINCGKGGKTRRQWNSEQIEHYHSAMSKVLKGRTSPTKGRRWYNNGVEQAMLLDCPEGWVPGRIGNTWSKGRKLTNAQKEHLRQAHLGKPLSESTKEKLKKLVFYNDGTNTIRLRDGEPVPVGFVKGRAKKK